MSAIDFASMAYPESQNNQHAALDFVNDPVLSDPNAVGILLALELIDAAREGFPANESIFSAIRDCTSLGRRRKAYTPALVKQNVVGRDGESN